VLFFYFFLAVGVKTATVAKLRGQFCSFFFLGGQNRNFVKVRGRKLILNQKETKINCLLYLVSFFRTVYYKFSIIKLRTNLTFKTEFNSLNRLSYQTTLT